VINEFGATRWDVSVRALRGELDPPAWVPNSELSPGVLLSSLVDFPTMHEFSIVAKAGVDKAAFVADMRQAISRVCQAPVEDDRCAGSWPPAAAAWPLPRRRRGGDVEAEGGALLNDARAPPAPLPLPGAGAVSRNG
jgi:hypothetical protein